MESACRADRTCTDLPLPAVDNPEWRDYLSALADTAERRAPKLGREVGERAAPRAFGPVLTGSEERSGSERQAGSVAAAVRELADHTSADDPLGRAPVTSRRVV